MLCLSEPSRHHSLIVIWIEIILFLFLCLRVRCSITLASAMYCISHLRCTSSNTSSKVQTMYFVPISSLSQATRPCHHITFDRTESLPDWNYVVYTRTMRACDGPPTRTHARVRFSSCFVVMDLRGSIEQQRVLIYCDGVIEIPNVMSAERCSHYEKATMMNISLHQNEYGTPTRGVSIPAARACGDRLMG